ncbi:probable disease resistance protein At4g27220 [Alnus glutinosa]|uniref:probable disease resistance protein At4g27220 n=1 Tax=Alnus glutinosa TaxID=3517 RepID=UPI002D7A3EB8|nr:probable disease resistance protein At4g27220 [Alnus glutinosa]
MEIVIAIAAKIVEYTVAPVGQWLCYSFRYSNNIGSVKYQVEKLRLARDSMQHSIDVAIRNGEEIEGEVNKWLKEVDEITELARKVLEGEEEAKMKCSNGACLNLKVRHQLSHKAAKIVKDIGEVLKNGSFDRVSYRPAPQGIVTTRYVNYMDFESRMSTVKGLMEALGDANINVIGMWGMPGVGKTTLARVVANQAKEEKLFDEVAMADVTQSPDLRKIQGEIADMLDLKFDKETVLGRAIRLRERLSQHRKILVILDDIWVKLDFEKIGIPSEGCKVLLISRNRDVFCEMGTQKDFRLEILPEEEAWNLLENMAGDYVKDPNFRCVATEVAKECEGLPLAIVTVSKALKNKTLSEWKDALKLLRSPAPGHLTRMQKTIYSSIELSYSHLESEEVKYFFLRCAQMGFFIHYKDLLKYCYGLGSFHGINTLEDARNRLNRLVRNLKDSCLLLDCPHSSKEFHMHMHDVVRDVATLIASKDHDIIIVRDDDGLKERLDVDALKRCKEFSMHGGDFHRLPDEMECPELRFLCMNGGGHSLPIPYTFFQGMGRLKVLDLTQMQLSPLPSSLPLLRNLRTLCLDGCVLGDIAVIGELKNLEILSLLKSHIWQLPREIGLLTRLRLLDLSHCSKLEVIPPNVLSSLVALEELYMGNSFVQWEAEGLNNASLAELKNLSHLITLEIHIPDESNLPKDLLFEKLERYVILVGDVWDWPDNQGEASRILKLKLNTNFQSAVGIKLMLLIKRTENLYLDELKGVTSVLNEFDREGFQQLKHLHIQNNSEIKYIINSSMLMDITFLALETILLENMTGLEEICHGQLPSLRSFGNLRIAKVERCDKLKFVFSSSIARGLSQLEQLEIRECSIMEEILVTEELGAAEETILKVLFPQLKFLILKELPILKRFCKGINIKFSSLKHLVIDNCPKLKTFISKPVSLGMTINKEPEEMNADESPHTLVQPLFDEKVAFPSLEYLSISHMDDLKILWHTQLAVDSFYKLQRIHVRLCENLVNVFQSDTLTRFQSLEELLVRDCGSLQEVFELQGLNVTKMQAVTTIQLKILGLFCLPNMKHVWSEDPKPIFSFQNLKIVRVLGCTSLKGLFPASVATCLTQLEQLMIDFCYELEEIIAGEKVAQPIAKFFFPEVRVLHLLNLPRLKWFYRGVHTSEWPKLKVMLVGWCPKIEILASELLSFQDIVGERQVGISVKQPLFLVDDKVPFPLLEKLRISCMTDLKIIWHNKHFTANSYCNPHTILKFEFCENLVVQETCVFPATQLKELHLLYLPKLKHIWNKDPQQISNFQNPIEVHYDFPAMKDVQFDGHSVAEIISEEL